MSVVKYRWDDLTDNIHQETDENGTIDIQYTQKPERYGHIISQRRNTTKSFYHFDGIGSTRKLTNVNQVTVKTYVYSAFGETVAETGVATNAFCYVGGYGYYTDTETSDLCIRRRKYNPSMARWLSIDPLQFVTSKAYGKSFTYTDNQPITNTDPSGLMTVEVDPERVTLGPCNGYRAFLEYTSDFQEGIEEIAYIQKICIFVDGFIDFCRPRGYLEGACCIPHYDCDFKECCYLELLRKVKPEGGKFPPSIDTNTIPVFSDIWCSSSGRYSLTAQVKAIVWDDDVENTIDEWPEDSSCENGCVVNIGMDIGSNLPITKNTELPGWWTDGKVENGGHTVDEISVRTNVFWRCCSQDCNDFIMGVDLPYWTFYRIGCDLESGHAAGGTQPK